MYYSISFQLLFIAKNRITRLMIALAIPFTSCPLIALRMILRTAVAATI